MRFGLSLVRGAREGEVFTLSANESVVLGRGTDASFRIQDPSISRRHCQISFTPPHGLLIADLGSSNGTYVNGTQLPPGWMHISAGDQVILGQNEIRVLGDLDAASPRQPPQESYQCTQCNRMLNPSEVQQKRYRHDTNGRLICAGCLEKFEFDPNLVEGYQITKKLGEGAFATVYKATPQGSNMVIALKTIRPQLVASERDVQRFLREAETGRQLVHPNIARVYATGESKGNYFIAMEYVEGKEITRLIEEFGQLDVGYTLRVGIQIAAALQHMFERGVVHRDIKPDNVMVSTKGEAKLVDFGLAKSFADSGQSGLTAPGEGMGTLAYMPPEQLDNALNADQRSDIYSLGATLHHMLSGRRPFEERTTRAFISKILHHAPSPLRQLNPHVPSELESLVSRALQKSPPDRYQTPAELGGQLTALFQRLAAEHEARGGA